MNRTTYTRVALAGALTLGLGVLGACMSPMADDGMIRMGGMGGMDGMDGISAKRPASPGVRA